MALDYNRHVLGRESIAGLSIEQVELLSNHTQQGG